MLSVYEGSIKPEWDLFDILGNTERQCTRLCDSLIRELIPLSLFLFAVGGDSVHETLGLLIQKHSRSWQQ
jgi:hypothetical protein